MIEIVKSIVGRLDENTHPSLPLPGQSGGGRKAEAIATIEVAKDMLWMKRFLLELGVRQDEYMVFNDSSSAMNLSKNAAYHFDTKHIDVSSHLIYKQNLA